MRRNDGLLDFFSRQWGQEGRYIRLQQSRVCVVEASMIEDYLFSSKGSDGG